MPLSLLPKSTRGAALLTAEARRAGEAAAGAAAAVLQELLGAPVSITGAPLPGVASEAAGMTAVSVALEAAFASATLEVDSRLVARALEQLGGEATRTPAARDATAREAALLHLCTLAAIDALQGGPVEALVPRLELRAGAPPSRDALVVALELAVGEERGRGRLRVPAAALRALSRGAEPTEAAAALRIELALRTGTATLARAELDLLAPGDVLLLDDGVRRDELALPGGLTLRGRLEGSAFHVQEIAMTETQASYPLTLTVEVARVTVTFGELARLEPGAVLALDARRDGAVVLRAGERALARGELVDLDGALGVRLIELEGRP
jgi:type III secretion protein Q